jgi:hypothetical protein
MMDVKGRYTITFRTKTATESESYGKDYWNALHSTEEWHFTAGTGKEIHFVDSIGHLYAFRVKEFRSRASVTHQVFIGDQRYVQDEDRVLGSDKSIEQELPEEIKTIIKNRLGIEL